VPDGSGGDELLGRACRELHDRFGVEHATLQIERGDPAHPCRLASADVVYAVALGTGEVLARVTAIAVKRFCHGDKVSGSAAETAKRVA
jgi:hypothetical protein